MGSARSCRLDHSGHGAGPARYFPRGTLGGGSWFRPLVGVRAGGGAAEGGGGAGGGERGWPDDRGALTRKKSTSFESRPSLPERRRWVAWLKRPRYAGRAEASTPYSP